LKSVSSIIPKEELAILFKHEILTDKEKEKTFNFLS